MGLRVDFKVDRINIDIIGNAVGGWQRQAVGALGTPNPESHKGSRIHGLQACPFERLYQFLQKFPVFRPPPARSYSRKDDACGEADDNHDHNEFDQGESAAVPEVPIAHSDASIYKLELNFVDAENGGEHAHDHGGNDGGGGNDNRGLHEDHQPLDPSLKLGLEVVSQTE